MQSIVIILYILLINQVINAEEICDSLAKYRTFDGSCNNLKHTDWGKVGTPYLRIAPAHYGENNGLPTQVNGKKLPNVRNLSLNFFPGKDVDDSVSLIFMQFGQIITHDITLTLPNDVSLNCCQNNNQSNCAAISIDKNDPFYSKYKVTCLNLVRNAYQISPEGIREQINNVTHMIDGSQIYGSSLEISNSLRTKICGKLKFTVNNDRDFLPVDENCTNNACYRAGDIRVNQNLDLTILQTLLMREHNRIADQFCETNTNWDDETIFQETRRIIIAILQHIIYDDYLPIVFNMETLIKYKLISTNLNGTKYDENIEPIIINSFTAGAFRYLHSGIQQRLDLANYHLQTIDYVNITDFIDNTSMIEDNNNFDELTLGLIAQKMHKLAPSMTKCFNGRFKRGDKPYGSDLTAIDIQRGRDHGLPNYITIVKLCNNIEINSFNDLNLFMKLKNIEKLKKTYTYIEDIDLFVGGALENKAIESKLGPTFQCILAKQFHHLKFGDRYFYDVENQPHSFTSEQLNNIKNIRLAKIICENSDDIDSITKNVFLLPSLLNPTVNCSTLDGINLNLWKY